MPSTQKPETKTAAPVQNETTEMKKLASNLGAGFNKKQADKVFMNRTGETIKLTEEGVKSSDSVYLKNCNECEFLLEAMSTKIFVESCADLKLTINERVITQTLEIWKCKNVQININTTIQTLQVDMSDNVAITYKTHEEFNRLVWSCTENVSLEFIDAPEHTLKTSSTKMASLNTKINAETDQFIVRLLPNKLTGESQLMNELIVRLDNGFPTTEREARQFEERQEANLKILAKEILGQDINIGKKKDAGPKIGRNDPCICGSAKKYKKCCGSDTVG